MTVRNHGRRKGGPVPIKALGLHLPADLLARLDAFCETGPIKFSRSSMMELAITRLLDQLGNNPANLFTK